MKGEASIYSQRPPTDPSSDGSDQSPPTSSTVERIQVRIHLLEDRIHTECWAQARAQLEHEPSRPDGGGGGGGGGGARARPATMTRDNLYWLSHDQVALFKKFRDTASRCKQTINHVVPMIKQLSSLLYDSLLQCKNRSRIHPKIWLPVPIPKYPQYWIHVPTLVPRKERERK
ncbi:hypothetical protein Lal_00028159 [Lupinus albus]|nr:hypothetical protein Lal_00028159 [Lupinus albus]